MGYGNRGTIRYVGFLMRSTKLFHEKKKNCRIIFCPGQVVWVGLLIFVEKIVVGFFSGPSSMGRVGVRVRFSV